MIQIIDPLEYLFSLPIDTRASLQELFAIADKLGSPQKNFPIVHVTGSNGKGSVCLKIAKALELSGYKVGLFTSPHIHSYCERMRINSQCIDLEEVKSILLDLFTLTRNLGIELNYFQYTTLASLVYFNNHKVDVAVVEVGIGGRLDPTRIFDPILSIITSISLEHTDVLGDTREKIGKEKAGICKMGVPLVLGPYAQVSTVEDFARELGCPMHIADRVNGSFDEENISIAKLAISILKEKFLDLTALSEQQGLKEMPSCRMQKMDSFILDVAHNPDAFKRLFQDVKRMFSPKKLQLIVGISSDKDVEGCMAIAATFCDKIYLVQANGARAAKKEKLVDILNRLNFTHFEQKETVACAINAAKQTKDVLTVVCGSFYIMGEAESYLNKIKN